MNLYYCTECRRVLEQESKCNYCGAENINALKRNSVVNVIGTKLKGKVLSAENDKINLIVNTENNEKLLKQYSFEKIRKII